MIKFTEIPNGIFLCYNFYMANETINKNKEQATTKQYVDDINLYNKPFQISYSNLTETTIPWSNDNDNINDEKPMYVAEVELDTKWDVKQYKYVVKKTVVPGSLVNVPFGKVTKVGKVVKIYTRKESMNIQMKSPFVIKNIKSVNTVDDKRSSYEKMADELLLDL